MAIVNLRQASAHLGFRTTTTLRKLLQAGELSAYVRSGPDLRATYLDVAPKGRPTLRQHVQAHTECRGNSPLWGADYESWPKPSGNWTDVANSYLDLPQWGPPPWTELQWVTLRNVIELAEDARTKGEIRFSDFPIDVWHAKQIVSTVRGIEPVRCCAVFP